MNKKSDWLSNVNVMMEKLNPDVRLINEAVKEQLNESSINRAIHFMMNHDIACITAFRGKFENATERTLDDRPEGLQEYDRQRGVKKAVDKTPYVYKMAEKKKRNRDLKGALLKYGYGVTAIGGNYIENFGTPDAREMGENSYLVVNLNDDPNFYQNVFDLSELYNQDCFLYKEKDSDDAYNIGTNNGEWPGYNVKEAAGKFHQNVKSEFLSRIGNSSFAFKLDGQEIENGKTPYNFQTRKQQRAKEYRNESKEIIETYDNLSRNAKYVITNISETIKKQISGLNGK